MMLVHADDIMKFAIQRFQLATSDGNPPRWLEDVVAQADPDFYPPDFLDAYPTS